MLAFPGCLHVPAREAEGSWVEVDKQKAPEGCKGLFRHIKDHERSLKIIKDHFKHVRCFESILLMK